MKINDINIFKSILIRFFNAFSKSPQKLILFFLLFILILPNIYSWCIFGIGTTCSDESHSGIGGFFNYLIDAGANLWNRIFKSTPTVNPDTYGSFENIYKDDIIGDDESIGREININSETGNVRGRLKVKGQSQVLSQEQAMWFDLDIVSSDMACSGCLSSDIEAGHTLLIYYSIKNYGNIINTNKFNLNGRIITPEGTIPLNYQQLSAYITGGSEFEFIEPIPRFGVDSKGNIKEWALGAGYVNITLELEITNDHNVEFAGITKISVPKQREYYNEEYYIQCIDSFSCPCDGIGCAEICMDLYHEWEDSCNEDAYQTYTYYEVETHYSCPDGTETEYTNGADCKVEELGEQNKLSNKIIKSFSIKKLTAPLEGEGGFGIFG